ncbi:MAG TPA: D-alanine--D-alanine ligase [Tepidisphaeraceae bacterium]|nr:D-alanine--D-alanine ligase [Tepidisphaeraceae bacterium]
MNITVLYGGPSAEREVSLVSGRAVAQGLRDAGHTVTEVDVRPETLADALAKLADVVFPVLHGTWGEDGTLQTELEKRGIKFVGSGSVASRLGMNKVDTKRAWEAAGLPTPPYRIVTSDSDPIPQEACVVKAIDSGSSVDVYVCKGQAEGVVQPVDAVRRVLANHSAALVEKFIAGPELTVGLLEEKALAPIRIVPKVEFFDYEAKYKRADTEHRFDTGLPAELVETCQRLAERANAIVGARDLARVDIMIDGATNQPFLLEINTLPGFTPKSLLPEAAAHAGVPFAKLVDRLVRRAAAR